MTSRWLTIVWLDSTVIFSPRLPRHLVKWLLSLSANLGPKFVNLSAYSYRLDNLRSEFHNDNIGLYRDDGLDIFRNMCP